VVLEHLIVTLTLSQKHSNHLISITHIIRCKLVEECGLSWHLCYSSDPGHGNWQAETAGWNWAGFFNEGLETCWQQFGQFLNDLQKLPQHEISHKT